MGGILTVLITVIVIAALGLVFGLLLAFAGKIFEVKKDEREEKILSELPGANCGGCGYSGCAAYAKAVMEGAEINKCSVGGDETSAGIANIMGVENERTVRMRAQVRCV